MRVPVTHVIRDHAGSAQAPFTGRPISEIISTHVNLEKALLELDKVSSLPRPLSVIGFRLGDATLEI